MTYREVLLKSPSADPNAEKKEDCETEVKLEKNAESIPGDTALKKELNKIEPTDNCKSKDSCEIIGIYKLQHKNEEILAENKGLTFDEFVKKYKVGNMAPNLEKGQTSGILKTALALCIVPKEINIFFA